MRKTFRYVLLAAIIGLTGCAHVTPKVIIDGVLGHYPHFDSSEYNRAVNLEIEAKLIAKENDGARVNVYVEEIENFKLYVDGRPYNERISKETDLLLKVTKELQARLAKGTVSPAYFKAKCENIAELADNIRKSIGAEKL